MPPAWTKCSPTSERVARRSCGRCRGARARAATCAALLAVPLGSLRRSRRQPAAPLAVTLGSLRRSCPPAGCAGPTHPLADAAQERRAARPRGHELACIVARRSPRLGPRATARPRGPLPPRFHLETVTRAYRAERCGNAAVGCMGPSQPLRSMSARGRRSLCTSWLHGPGTVSNRVPHPVRGVAVTLESGSPPRSRGCGNPRIGVPTPVKGLR
jgi:hypothetical protein